MPVIITDSHEYVEFNNEADNFNDVAGSSGENVTSGRCATLQQVVPGCPLTMLREEGFMVNGDEVCIVVMECWWRPRNGEDRDVVGGWVIVH